MTNLNLFNALRLKYEGEIASAKANLAVYMQNTVGIGEHADIVTTLDTEVQKLCDASDKRDVLIEFLSENSIANDLQSESDFREGTD